MSASRIPPREPFAAACRALIEAHDEWDSPHAFQTLRWDGGELAVGTHACVMPDIHPDRYPDLMRKIVTDEIRDRPGEPAYAFAIQIEGFGVRMPPESVELSAAERARFRADSIGRTFHKRPDRVEICTAHLADIHGRMWTAGKYRGGDEAITEKFYAPGDPEFPAGQMVRGLLACAHVTGAVMWGLPLPMGRMAN